MCAAHAKKFMPHIPQGLGFQLQPDQEQHHDNAEFGEMLQVGCFTPRKVQHRADQDTGGQISQNRAKAKAHAQRHHQNGGTKIKAGKEQKTFHWNPFKTGRQTNLGSNRECSIGF